jgi:enterochelin esterase-like enzyme
MATSAEWQGAASRADNDVTQQGDVPVDDAVTQGVGLSDDAVTRGAGRAADDAVTRDGRLVARQDASRESGDPGLRRYVRLPTPMKAKGWRYVAEGRRDLRLDLLRGFAVFAMVVDHIGGASWLYALTGGNRFFVSAAEAFVFISGLTVGIVYGDRLRRDGLRSVTKRLLNRAWMLYALAVWLAIGTAFFAATFGLPRGVILSANPARFIIEVITLQRTFYLVDVMLLYAFLLALSPLALAALRAGGWWYVLLISCALWSLHQSLPTELALPWRIVDNPVFNFAPWQLLFFVGLLIGYGREWLARAIIDRVPRSPLNDGWMMLPLVLFGGLVFVHATNGATLARYVPGGDTAAWLDFWFDKSTLPLPRLAACAIVFTTFWLIVTRCWVPIRRFAGWLLLPLGQRALYAYAAHLFLITLVQLLVLTVWRHGRESDYSTLHPGLDAAIQIVGVGILWALTRARFLQEIVAPLGRAPFTEVRWHWRRWSLPRPSDAFAALLVVAIISGLLLLPGGWGLRGASGVTLSPASTSGNALPVRVVPPESTVTVPRRVGGSVRGSSGLSGRSDQTTPTVAPQSAPTSVTTPIATARATAQPTGAATPMPTPISGGYLQDGEFFSAALGRTMPYGIYLPPTYDSEPGRRYPVLYMLHGGGGHYSEWVAYGLPEKAEDLTWDGQIQPVIIVMPQGDQSFWANHSRGDDERWGDYVAFDLVEHIDATYRTIPEAASRAIGGLSMGGFGSLQLAFNHPEIFGTVGAHSPALHDYQGLSNLFTPAAFEELDPVELASTLDPKSAPLIWVDAGADDALADRTIVLAIRLDARGISHRVRLLPGRHNADYWSQSTGDYLRFYSQSVVGGPVGVRPPQ